MRKIVKKYGNSFILLLDQEDVEIYKLKEGDVLDIEICKEENCSNEI